MTAAMGRAIRPRVGTVYLVGAGPGDPGLLTVKGQELLQRADAVVSDHLVSPRLVECCAPQAEHINVGKEPARGRAAADRRGKPLTTQTSGSAQRAINARLIRLARAGKMVVRLKGGDPFLFGRGGEEALALTRAGVPYEVVPGVTSALAVPAYAGIPLTHRNRSSSVAIVTGHEDPAKPEPAVRWDRLSAACDTLVCLMGVATLPEIARQLLRHGRAPSTPCAVIEWGTWPRQRTVTGPLRAIAERARRAAIRPPAVIVIGEVVALRRWLAWREHRPLFGRRILVTRAAEKAGTFAAQLEALGAEVEQLPAIALEPVEPNGWFQEALEELPRTDWVFFTSPEGIGWLARALRSHRRDLRCLGDCRIGAIGPKTALAIEAHGLHVDVVPRQFSQEGLLRALPSRLLTGQRAVLVSSEGSRQNLEQGLRARGMQVRKVPIYRAVIPPALREEARRVLEQPFDAVTVTSASCVEHLFQALRAAQRERLFGRLRFASIGPITSRAVRAHGGRVAVEARSSTVEGLIEAMVRRLGRARGRGS
jgi:uroporphyrinogen III methyltransferase/synthase